MTFDRKLHNQYKELLSTLDEFIVGQNRAKEWIAMVAAEHVAGIRISEGEPRVVLLVGATGTGKTELCRTLARIMKVPFLRVDATELTQTSFRGRQIESVIRELANLHDLDMSSSEDDEKNDPDALHDGVVLIDEFDKIAFQPGNKEQVQERHLFAVQAELLRLFEGKNIKIDESEKGFDSSRLLILAAGAFQNEEVAKFVREREGIKVDPLEGPWPFITHEDLIRFGLLPELVGRIRAIVALQKLSSGDMLQIIKKRILQGNQEILGCRIVLDNEAADVIASRALERNLGGRAIGIIFSEIRLHVFKNVSGIIVDEDVGTIRLTKQYAMENWLPTL